MESKLKAERMDAVGELPEIGNLLLQEFGYPHLPDPVFVPEKKPIDWNDASTNPTQQKVYQTKVGRDEVLAYQYWDGEKWKFACGTKEQAYAGRNWPETELTTRTWREVQP